MIRKNSYLLVLGINTKTFAVSVEATTIIFHLDNIFLTKNDTEQSFKEFDAKLQHDFYDLSQNLTS